MKKIRKSKRGLTFSIGDASKIGTKFRYYINKSNNEIIIFQDVNGTGTVSRKKSGNNFKPLYDIRTKEVKALVSEADYLEVEDAEDRIIVRAYKKVKSFQWAQKSEIIRIQDVLAVHTGEIIVNKVVGADYPEYLFGHPTLANDEYFEALLRQAPKNWNCRKEKKNVQNVYNVMSLFSGAGLLDYSLKDTQFRFVYAVDFDKDACETYKANIGNHIVCRDIREIDSSTIPNADVVIGGPCCQGYSNSNRRNIDSEAAEQKRLLIEDYVRIVKDKNPKVFVIENVPQFMSKDQGIYFEHVLNNLSDYEITATVITDSEVGGYTARKRAIVIGSRIGAIKLPDAEIHTAKTVKDALSKVDATWFNFNDVSTPREETVLAMSYVKPGGNWKDIPEEVHKFDKNTHSDRFRRLSWDEISPTIVNWRKICMMPPEGNRILSVAEAAALMGLDRDFKIMGATLNVKQQQIANGVTQAIGRFVKKYVLDALNLHSESNVLKFAT